MNQSIPVATPVTLPNNNLNDNIPNVQPIIPINSVQLAPMPHYQPHRYESATNIQQIRCRDCGTLFTRNSEDQGSSSYFRCQDCQKKQLTRSLCASCCIQ